LNIGLEITWGFTWSPDSRSIAVAGGDPSQVWVVGADGTGLRRLTSDGNNSVVGWTRLAPVLPPAAALPPTERAIAADTVETSTPVTALAADGTRVAFAPKPGSTDCEHVVVWTPGVDSLRRLGPLRAPCHNTDDRGVLALALAGSRVVWLAKTLAGDSSLGEDCAYTALRSATLADPLAVELGRGYVSCKGEDPYHMHGAGDLLVVNVDSSLVRIGVGSEKCGAGLCTTLRKDALAWPVDSVATGLIATRKPGAVAVLDAQGKLVRRFPFTPADVYAARLDGTHLVVTRSYTLESYDLATGARDASQPLPAGYQLTDADDGIAVLRHGNAVLLLRLADGRLLTLTPGEAPVLAGLEPPGLYYSYATPDGGGRLVFVPRDELLRQLGGA
jgi:hypothetical protein